MVISQDERFQTKKMICHAVCAKALNVLRMMLGARTPLQTSLVQTRLSIKNGKLSSHWWSAMSDREVQRKSENVRICVSREKLLHGPAEWVEHRITWRLKKDYKRKKKYERTIAEVGEPKKNIHFPTKLRTPRQVQARSSKMRNYMLLCRLISVRMTCKIL